MQPDVESTILAPSGFLATRLKSQLPRLSAASRLPVFYQNLEGLLDHRRNTRSLYTIVQNYWQTSDAVDFCSGDILSLNASGSLRKEFLAELADNPNFTTGSGGVRLMDGNYSYLEQAEQDIATFHGAETGLIVGSAFEANVAVWTALPRPGDVLLYDKLVHASTHEGMRRSRASQLIEFQHNSVENFQTTVRSILDKHPLIREKKCCILVAVESMYSMDGDLCPLEELIRVGRQMCGENIQFIVDEAHSVGVIGPNGSGLVCQLGLEREVAVVVHSYGKAMGATGAVILANDIVRNALVNFGKSIIFTTSPSFPFAAAIKAAYNLLQTTQADIARENIQSHARLFFTTLKTHPLWKRTQQTCILRVPLAEGWEDRPLLSHIVTVSTRQDHLYWLFVHLMAASFSVFPVPYPIVPLGQSRLRIIFHADNTPEQIVGLVNAMFTWAAEIIAMEDGESEEKETSVVKEVNRWMKDQGLNGAL